MDSTQVVLENKNLIYKIATKFYGIDKDDLFQAGVLGLLKALRNYKNNHNTKFSSYAYDYIYGEMYVLAHNKAMKVNKDILKLYRDIEKTRFSLAQKYGEIPDNNKVAAFLEMDVKIVDEACLAGKEVMSIDNDETRPLIEVISSDEEVSLDDKILINECMEVLSCDEREIIKARYFEDLTQSETAKKLCMTQVMVSRYEKKSLDKMQSYLVK